MTAAAYDGSTPSRNARHELFAQGIAEGKTATGAYTEAGYKATGNSAEAVASRLLRNVKVRGRVAFLQGEAAKNTIVTIDSTTRELEEARGMAKDKADPNTMRSCSMDKAKVNGLLKDSVVHSGTVEITRIEHVIIDPAD